MTGPRFAALLLVLSVGGTAANAGIIERSPYLANSFNILAYNIFMRPTSLFANDQSDRAEVLPSKLSGFDAITFSEAFDDGIRNKLLADLRGEYPYRTEVLGTDGGIEQDGGVIILSRWPITAQAQRLYGGACKGTDCLADKGVLYARIVKHGRAHHVFASHTQAGDDTDERETRTRQLRIIKRFIDDHRLPESEPVFIAGDLNVDKYDSGEYATMLQTLDASYPQPFGQPYTVDSVVNSRANGRKYLDYVLVSNRHLQPASSIIETFIPRSPIAFGGDYDLSDHFPVFGHFMFPSPAEIIATN